MRLWSSRQAVSTGYNGSGYTLVPTNQTNGPALPPGVTLPTRGPLCLPVRPRSGLDQLCRSGCHAIRRKQVSTT